MKLFSSFIALLCLAGLGFDLSNGGAPSINTEVSQVTSTNLLPPTLRNQRCGDGTCDGPETSKNCPEDCADTTTDSSQQTIGASLPLMPSPPEPEVIIHVEVSPDGNKIQPLLGVNDGPLPAGEDGNADLTQAYWDIGVNMIRTHDFYGPLDMATLFPDQSADPTDPASYDFKISDIVFESIVSNGFEPYLRLGDSWESGGNFPKADPRAPTNPDNWARAAVDIVRHYRDLAQQHGVPLRYVEIWNEPNHPQFWNSSPLVFFELFAHTAAALKTEFPGLLIGGPGLAGTAFGTPEGQQFIQLFLDYLRDNAVPLDFLSWHIYSNDPNSYAENAIYYRELLDIHGFTDAESHVTEWNTDFKLERGDDPNFRVGAKGASIITAAWIALQENGVDVSTFFRGNDTSSSMPTFYGLFYADGNPKPIAHAFSLWSQTVAHRQMLEVTSEDNDFLWFLCGQNQSGNIAILVANPTEQPTSWAVSPEGTFSSITLQQVSDDSSEIQMYSLSVPAIQIGAYSVQLVLLSP